MDVSPIQRLSITANQAVKAPVVPAVEAPATQAPTAPADVKQAATGTSGSPATRVTVAWHAASLGYVTRVVDSETGTLLHQTPPDEVLALVQQVIERLEGGNA